MEEGKELKKNIRAITENEKHSVSNKSEKRKQQQKSAKKKTFSIERKTK